jgi:hypothetical protein
LDIASLQGLGIKGKVVLDGKIRNDAAGDLFKIKIVTVDQHIDSTRFTGQIVIMGADIAEPDPAQADIDDFSDFHLIVSQQRGGAVFNTDSGSLPSVIEGRGVAYHHFTFIRETLYCWIDSMFFFKKPYFFIIFLRNHVCGGEDTGDCIRVPENRVSGQPVSGQRSNW